MGKSKIFFVIGVSGSGKSTVGQMVANDLNLSFEDGDSYHKEENVIKMSSGIPLQDNDRWDWLAALNEMGKGFLKQEKSVVIACSALKTVYRSILSKDVEHQTQFIYLDGTQAMIGQRIKEREHFFCGDAMLESQFSALELPSRDEAKFIDISQEFEVVVKECKTFIDTLIGE